MTYIIGFMLGKNDKKRSKPMKQISAIRDMDKFRGYFDGYMGVNPSPPNKRQALVEKNIREFNFIT